jgi:NADH dehydrogenase
MNLIVGATGLLGSEICRLLTAAGQPLRTLIRATTDPDKVENLKRLGAELVEGDLKDRASLDIACQGITAIISTASSVHSQQPYDTIQSVDQEGQLNLIEAARAAGVARFIYISYSGNIDIDSPLTRAKRTVEQHLKQSGIAYTILRPSYFMEVWLSPALGFDVANAKAQVYGSGQNKISYISFQDVARFAVHCLDHPAARNTTIELGGPESLSQLEVVRIFEELAGRKFEVQHVPEETLQNQQAAATNLLQQSFAALMLDYAQGDSIDMRSTLKVFPVQLTSVRELNLIPANDIAE